MVPEQFLSDKSLSIKSQTKFYCKYFCITYIGKSYQAAVDGDGSEAIMVSNHYLNQWW